ncbi:MAG: DUF2270 domain-containing protein [Candidatus Aenigmatarchaeota archaeon]
MTARNLQDQIDSNILTHFYRGERQRSNTWRKRLDATTNWSVIITGGILTFVFSRPDISHFTLILGMFLIIIFLSIESRRYRFFDIWRSRLRLMEGNFIIPALKGKEMDGNEWKNILIDDIKKPKFKITKLEAVTRRLRRIYNWLISIYIAAWFWKLAIHPVPANNITDIITRASVGPISGLIVMLSIITIWGIMLLLSFHERGDREAMGKIGKMDEGEYDWKTDTEVN